jgi:hypothetical protein
MKHLAIFRNEMGEAILSGEKTIESRFSVKKIAPFGVISAGDIVYIKPAGKDLIGQFRVRKVIFFDGLEKEDVLEIKKKYGPEILASEKFWGESLLAKYGTLIFIGEGERYLTPPLKISKKDARGWVVLD